MFQSECVIHVVNALLNKELLNHNEFKPCISLLIMILLQELRFAQLQKYVGLNLRFMWFAYQIYIFFKWRLINFAATF